MNKPQTFEPGTLIPRGIYIRKCETGMFNKQHFAKLADKERDLRLDMMKSTNWLSGFFAKEPDKEELKEFLEGVVSHVQKLDYDMSEFDNWIQETFK